MTLCMVALGCLFGCGGGGYSSQASPPPPPLATSITISGPSNPMNVGTARTFTATVHNSTNQAVTWSVEELSGGSVTPEGQYTAPSLPGTFHVTAVSQAVSSAFATAPIPVVIPVGHIPGYEVDVDYHATGSDFLHSTFMTTYQQASIRQAVLSQLQGVADRGATVISTRIWLVTEPGTTNFGETWRATFPMSDQEETNLHTYAQDVANIVGSGGNRLRLDVVLLWLANSYGRSFLPTPSWIGSLFLRDRRVCPIAAVTRAAPITIPKITSIVIGFPFALFQCVETLMSVLGAGGTPLLKAIPVSCEKSEFLEFAFGPEPIFEFLAWTGAAFEIDLVCAELDLVLSWPVVHGCFFCLLG